jgi:hypothetical protein
MKNIASFLIVLIIGCGSHHKKETMYFLFRGDRIYSTPDFVLKNDSQSFVDSIMPIGKPIESIVSVNTYANLKKEIVRHSLFDEKKDHTGIMVIFYDNHNKVGSYLFSSDSEINQLIGFFEENLIGGTKLQGIGWIDEMCKIHKI